jgi:hypothetical protein
VELIEVHTKPSGITFASGYGGKPLHCNLRYLQLIALAPLFFSSVRGQTPDQVLIVVNKQSVASREIGQYYMRKRGVPLANLCTIDTAPEEQIARKIYIGQVEAPIGKCLMENNLVEKALYIVTTYGDPLAIIGAPQDSLQTDAASVDSELTLLYQRLHGRTLPLPGAIPNPFFRQRDTPFRHPQFPMYLVTRLAAYDMAEMKGLDRRARRRRHSRQPVAQGGRAAAAEGSRGPERFRGGPDEPERRDRLRLLGIE